MGGYNFMGGYNGKDPQLGAGFWYHTALLLQLKRRYDVLISKRW